MRFLQLEPYTPPTWARHLSLVPTHRVRLAHAPTPIHRWAVPGLPEGVSLYIKRDDLTGMQLSGNKCRKLEFLMAAALQGGYDTIVTIGGIQSNHCRATAVAARYLGLDCHLILRNSRALADSDPGLVGNLLVERLAGAHVHQVTKEEYGRYGSGALLERLGARLRAQGRRPFLVPVGGSSALGVWGYLEMVAELAEQIQGQGFTDIAMACGSGGTTAGIALGAALACAGLRVHAFGVCDDPAYFYSFCDGLLDGLGASQRSAELFSAVQARGAGYAVSTAEELQTVADAARATGVVLDPVYTGKALHGLVGAMRRAPGSWAGRKVLFLHSGGLLGMYDKAGQLAPLVEATGNAHRLPLD